MLLRMRMWMRDADAEGERPTVEDAARRYG
jgi:hypothetical protein